MATCKIIRSLFVTVFVMSAVPLGAAERFRAGTADAYEATQSQAGVTLAVKPYHTELLEKEIFSKSKPNKFGIMPVLVVITNLGDAPIKLVEMHARYVPARSTEGVNAMTAEDLFFYNPKGHAPKKQKLPGPGNTITKVKKGPLSRPEIAEREFSAPVLPPGETASGFFYFNVGIGGDPLTGASLYVAGMTNMSTGQPLFYFEVPLD